MKHIAIILFIVTVSSLGLYSQNDCKITYVSNEGFLIESAGKKVLVDGLFNKIDGDWCDSPSDSIVELMKNAQPPFDNIDIIAITHKHKDHFSEDIVVNHLLNNPAGQLVCPKQVEEILGINPNYDKIRDRIIAITPNLYANISITISDIPIRILRLEHSHYMEVDSVSGNNVNRHRNVENLGYLFNVNNIKVFHCGDTNPLNEIEYSTFLLNEEEIDIAFVERLFFTKGKKSIEILNNYIQPKQIIVMHIRPSNINPFLNHFKTTETVNIYEHKMDSMILNFD